MVSLPYQNGAFLKLHYCAIYIINFLKTMMPVFFFLNFLISWHEVVLHNFFIILRPGFLTHLFNSYLHMKQHNFRQYEIYKITFLSPGLIAMDQFQIFFYKKVFINIGLLKMDFPCLFFITAFFS